MDPINNFLKNRKYIREISLDEMEVIWQEAKKAD